MSQKKTAAQEAIFEAITKEIAVIENDHELPVGVATKSLKDLAIAYRLAAGGAQPGGVISD